MQDSTQAWRNAFEEAVTGESHLLLSMNVVQDINGGNNAIISSFFGTSTRKSISDRSYFAQPEPPEYAKLSYLELNHIILDGTYDYIWDATEPIPYAGHIFSEEFMSDSSGNVASTQTGENPKFVCTFNAYQSLDIPYITVVWGAGTGAYPTMVSYIVYDGNDSIFTTIERIDYPHGPTHYFDLTGLVKPTATKYNKIEIEIHEWSDAFVRPRIGNITPGLRFDLTKEVLFFFEHKQEFGFLNEILPHASVEFSAEDAGWRWVASDEDGYGLIYGSEVCVKYGMTVPNGEELSKKMTKVDYINGGTFYITDVADSHGGTETRFTARNVVWFLNEINSRAELSDGEYSMLSSIASQTMEDVTTLPPGAGYSFDFSDTGTGVADNPIYALAPDATAGETLNYVSQLARGDIRVNRGKTIEFWNKHYPYTNYHVTEDVMFSPPKVETMQKIGTVNFETALWRRLRGAGLDAVVVDYKTKEEDDTPIVYEVEPKTWTFFRFPEPRFSKAFFTVDLLPASGEPAGTVTKEWHHAGVRIRVDHSGTVSPGFKYRIQIFSSNWMFKVVRTITPLRFSDSGATLDVANPIASSPDYARYFLANHKDLLKSNRRVSFEWRADPRVDAGDKIKIDLPRANSSVVEEKHALLTDVKFTYNGGMFRGLAEGWVVD